MEHNSTFGYGDTPPGPPYAMVWTFILIVAVILAGIIFMSCSADVLTAEAAEPIPICDEAEFSVPVGTYGHHAFGRQFILTLTDTTYTVQIQGAGTVVGAVEIVDNGYIKITDQGCSMPGRYDMPKRSYGIDLNIHAEDITCPRGPYLMGRWETTVPNPSTVPVRKVAWK